MWVILHDYFTMSFHILNTHDQGLILFYVCIQYLSKFTGHTSNIWNRWYFCPVLQMSSTRHRLVIWRCKASQPSVWRSQAHGEADPLEFWNPSHPLSWLCVTMLLSIENSDLLRRPGMPSVAIVITSNNHTNIYVYNIRSKCFLEDLQRCLKAFPYSHFPLFPKMKRNLQLSTF